MEQLKQAFKNISQVVGRMTPSQVMMLFGVTAGVIVGIILAIGWFSSATYARLYSNLDEAESGDVINALNEQKIPFKLTDNGRSIEIPSDKVYETRISLAADGLPRSGTIGYSIFDKNNLGMTDFLQNLNFRRALEGELTRTIMQMNEVKAARVHIVMPKDRLFKEDRKEATASVLLKLAGNGGLSKRQIAGITNLVASSVEGLKPNNIAIIDYDGNLLSSGREADAVAGLSSTQLDVRKNVEEYLESKAQSLLDGVLGPEKSIVRVTADLNFQQLERTSEMYDPNAPSIRSEERTKSANAANDKAAEAEQSTEEGSQETTITNYELNKTVEHIINAVGGIERLSLAVMVDGTYEAADGAGGEGGEMVYRPRPQEELDRLAAIVQNAVGFNTQRNDQIEIVNLAFDKRDIQTDRDALDSMYMREFYFDIAKKVGLVLLVLLVLFYFKRKLGRLMKSLGSLVPPARPVAAPLPMMEQQAEELPEMSPIEPEKRKPRLIDHMQKTAQDRPDEIAKVIKTLMIE
jgi:flagellar M-ring protein FliF